MSDHPVTDHAVVRYLERVHGFELTDRYPLASERYRAQIGAERLGLTVDDVRDLVCPPRLRPFLALGRGFVRAGDRTLPIVDGRVPTCLSPTVNTRKARIRAERARA